MTNTDYDCRSAIEAAKADPEYFQPFSKFTIRREPGAICIDVSRKTYRYSLAISATALSHRLNEDCDRGLYD